MWGIHVPSQFHFFTIEFEHLVTIGHTRYPIGFKPSAFHKVIDTYNDLRDLQQTGAALIGHHIQQRKPACHR